MWARWAGGLVAVATPLLAMPAAEAAPMCDEERATIVGTAAGDTLRGTRGDDVIAGLGGDDLIRGHGGDDRICGGDGSDALYGGSGRDRLLGGRDRLFVDRAGAVERIGDRLRGGHGPDRLVPGLDHRPADDVTPDLLSWSTSPRGVTVDLRHGTAIGDGLDTFVPGGATVAGSPYDDRVVGSDRGERILGGDGADLLLGRAGADSIHAGPGDDVVWAGPGWDEVTGGPGRDELHGGPGGDLVGDDDPGPNRLYGSRGDDHVSAQLSTGAGAVYDGGPGSDVLHLSSFLVNWTGAPSSGTWDLGTGALAFTGPVRVSAHAVGFDGAELTTAGTRWRVTGTTRAETFDATATAGAELVGRAGDVSLPGPARALRRWWDPSRSGPRSGPR